MGTTDGDASSRLDGAIADVLAGAPSVPGEPAPVVPAAGDWSVDDDDDDLDATAYTLPDIVPATSHRPEAVTSAPDVPAAPSLPHTVPSVPHTVPVVPPSTPTPTTPTPTPVPPTTVPTPGAAPSPAPRPTATSWSDHMTTVPPGAQGSALRAPGRRPRVRRVTRVLRHIDPWSTFKVALLFSAVAYLVALTAGVLLWRVADSTGTLDNIERWFTQFGWETFELKGGEIFHNAWIIGLFAAVALTGGLVLLATLFNLVSDIVGGVRMTVLEEEVVERTVSSTRRYVVRRPPTGDPGAGDWDVDDDATAETSADGTEASSPVAAPPDDWSVDDDHDDDADDDQDDDADDDHGEVDAGPAPSTG